ncbi:glycosyltransferase family 2 protein [Bradyrhizobium algeriense]|uniref:glycosyltransferase family 2 protein n=1 Tax=Bradyrhizobium algeriense TaxID=634784 RepID=UPI000D367CFA|nr:glycosyltransferase family 2 protein [Bradyrhizobium algeriense]
MFPAQPKIIILLATKDGGEYLQEQLDSLRAQTYSNWELQVSDDGSTDDTIRIVRSFAESVSQRVTVRNGPRRGFWQNFMSLVRNDEIDGDLFAYCDQDDIWFPEKLARAVTWLGMHDARQPALYFTRTELIGPDGTSSGHSPLFTRPPVFRNALVQNIGGGNTMVFNREARLKLRATPVDAVLIAHDWWTYQLVTGVGGVAHYDPWPSLKYRQHDQNIIGSNIGVRARTERLLAFLNGRVVTWNDINLERLGRMRDLLTPGNAAVLRNFAAARHSRRVKRLILLWKSGVYRQNLIDNIGLFIAALLGRL